MPRSAAASNSDALERAQRAIWGLLMRAGAASVVILSLFTLMSVATYAVCDPSWSTATARQVPLNWGGTSGAVLADVLLQSFGGGALLLPIVPLLWGVSTFRWGPPPETQLTAWAKMFAWLGGVFAIAGFASILPKAASWPFIVGMGGMVGDGVAALFSSVFAIILPPIAPALAAIVLLPLAALLSCFAAGMRKPHLVAGAEAFFWCYDAVAERVAAVWTQVEDAFTSAMQRYQEAKASGRAPRDGERVSPVFQAPSEEASNDEVEDLSAHEEYEDTEVADDDYEEEFAAAESYESEAFDDGPSDSKRKIIREVRKVPVRRTIEDDQPVFDASSYRLPPLKLLKEPNPDDARVVSDEELDERARMLESVLADFKIHGEIIKVRPGPVVTLYELEPAAGVKSSRVINLADDIARSMSAIACRVAVVPGRNAIGIELPNDDRDFVLFRELLSTEEFGSGKGLTLALGKDIGGEPQYADLAKMPHLLIAGTTGSGKSVGINTMILSLLYRLPPDQCKLIMVDPKMLELSVYEGIPHLLSPVVTDPRKAVVALKWTVKEMEDRYRNMSKLGVRNIHGFNERVREAEARGEELTRKVHSGYDAETNEPVYEEEVLEFEPMPFIVVVIDEVADLMMVAGKDIEAMVQRLAQMARAAGIHLIMATQRPSVDVITGTIKANFPTRISFQVTSKIDSRTILGEQGAEQLLGMGDMLFMAGGGRITRVHGAFVADDEVEKIVAHLKKQGKPDYVQEVTEGGGEEDAITAGQMGLDLGGNTSSGDALFDQAVAIIVRDRKVSTSYLQRRMQIGYNRAADLIDRLEDEGIISAANHAGKREILIGEDAA